MKAFKLDCRVILGVKLLQPLCGARISVPAGFAIGMQPRYAATVGLFELLEPTVAVKPQLSVQVEKIYLVSHAISPAAWCPGKCPITRLGAWANGGGTGQACRTVKAMASIFCT